MLVLCHVIPASELDGKRVGELARLKTGLTQRELAERADVPVTMISAYERDQRQPTLTTMLQLVRAAGFDLRRSRVRAAGPRPSAQGLA